MLMSEFPVVLVHIPAELRGLVAGRDEVMASGETIADVLQAVGHTYPDFASRVICGDGRLTDGLLLFLGGCQQPKTLASPVELEEMLTLVATGDLACHVPASHRPSLQEPMGEAVISIGE